MYLNYQNVYIQNKIRNLDVHYIQSKSIFHSIYLKMNDSVFLFFFNGYDKIGCFGPDSKLPKSITELLFSFLELFKHKELLP